MWFSRPQPLSPAELSRIAIEVRSPTIDLDGISLDTECSLVPGSRDLPLADYLSVRGVTTGMRQRLGRCDRL
jgi:hypothetical protein